MRLWTFGGIGIEPDDGSNAPRLRPPRLALLAVLAAAGERGVSRERLVSLFWPDADEPHAKQSLRQARYALRNELKLEVIRAVGSMLVLDDSLISSDIVEFRAALAAGDRLRAVELPRGPFLDGFYLPGSSAFSRWVEDERARLTAATISALLSLASEAAENGHRDAVVEWWRRLTLIDPLSGRFALGYLKALAARGNRAEALTFARQHEALVRRELEADPDHEILRLEGELRAMPGPQIARHVDAEPAPTQTRSQGPPVAVATAAPKTKPRSRRALVGASVIAAVAFVATVGFAWLRRADPRPMLAVGFIREEAVPESLRAGPVLTDMVATGLGRIDGLAVLANARVLELMRGGPDSAASYVDAARRAGASELLDGRLITNHDVPLALEMRRVDLRTGVVQEVYRVVAIDRYRLVDSLTRLVALRFRLRSPSESIAEATTSSPTAYRLYEEGLRAYSRNDVKSAQQLMRAALEDDSTFAMAAYYEALLATQYGLNVPDGRQTIEAVRSALHLAARAAERERLTITANLLALHADPRALAIAESLTTRYPDDPRALMTLERARWWAGDWHGAVAAVERAIKLDSIGGAKRTTVCYLCRDFAELGEVYLWSDSLSAANRAMRRYAAAVPETVDPYYNLSLIGARLGDSASAYAAFRRVSSQGGDPRQLKLRLDLTLERYDEVLRDATPLLASSWTGDWGVGAWNLMIALRNEGRLKEATQFHRTGSLPGLPALNVERTPDAFNQAILALERGDPRTAAQIFGDRLRGDMSSWMPGVRSRHLAWTATLQGMALAAAGDTSAVRRIADSVEQWGQGSAYGRDRRAHHYLRGLLLVASNRDSAAVDEFRAAIHSPTLGFTRVNYELARSLMRLGRPREAVAVLQPALRGEVDASNLYVTRTELHELLGQAFAAAEQPDSAALHYGAVVRAWRRADAAFHARRDRAVAWLARH